MTSLKPILRIAGASLLLVIVFGLARPASARPEFLQRFQSDPFRRAEVDGCTVCHVNPRGGGPRNDFGAVFQSEAHLITAMMRASNPDKFKFETIQIAGGATFYFADPEGKVAVFERDKKKTEIDLVTLSSKSDKSTTPVLPPAENRMSFFVTSKGVGNGGHLGGLAGADRHCQALAEAAGAGDRTWRAYLSTSFQDKAAVNAGDRIGSGPWYNAKGMLVARGVADLHNENRLSKETALTEKGEPISDASRHAVLTGSLPNGTAAVGMTCNNWSSADEGKAMFGFSDRQGSNGSAGSWNSAAPSNGCGMPALKAAGSDGLFYCFALR